MVVADITANRPRGAGNSAALRAFIQFACNVFPDLMRERDAFGPTDASPMPDWFGTGYVGRLRERSARTASRR